MTRLEAFAARVTREMLEAQYNANGWPLAEIGWRETRAARAVLEREVRATFADASVPLALAAWMATYLDEPAPTPRPLAGHTARRLEDE